MRGLTPQSQFGHQIFDVGRLCVPKALTAQIGQLIAAITRHSFGRATLHSVSFGLQCALSDCIFAHPWGRSLRRGYLKTDELEAQRFDNPYRSGPGRRKGQTLTHQGLTSEGKRAGFQRVRAT